MDMASRRWHWEPSTPLISRSSTVMGHGGTRLPRTASGDTEMHKGLLRAARMNS
jgi:hypothetical protein